MTKSFPQKVGLFISVTHQQMHIYIVFNNPTFTLKHLKRSYIFQSHDNHQVAYYVPC